MKRTYTCEGFLEWKKGKTREHFFLLDRAKQERERKHDKIKKVREEIRNLQKEIKLPLPKKPSLTKNDYITYVEEMIKRKDENFVFKPPKSYINLKRSEKNERNQRERKKQ